VSIPERKDMTGYRFTDGILYIQVKSEGLEAFNIADKVCQIFYDDVLLTVLLEQKEIIREVHTLTEKTEPVHIDSLETAKKLLF
jgi:hypothetical protein